MSIYKNKILFDNKFHHKFFNEFAKNITRRKKKQVTPKVFQKLLSLMLGRKVKIASVSSQLYDVLATH